MDLGNVLPSPQLESEITLPATRIRRLTERAKAMLEDELPEGAGDLLSEETLEDHPASVAPCSHDLPSSTLRIRIRRLFKTAVNKFGLVTATPTLKTVELPAEILDLSQAIEPLPSTAQARLKRRRRVQE